MPPARGRASDISDVAQKRLRRKRMVTVCDYQADRPVSNYRTRARGDAVGSRQSNGTRCPLDSCYQTLSMAPWRMVNRGIEIIFWRTTISDRNGRNGAFSSLYDRYTTSSSHARRRTSGSTRENRGTPRGVSKAGGETSHLRIARRDRAPRSIGADRDMTQRPPTPV